MFNATPENGGTFVGQDVSITLNVQFLQQVPPPLLSEIQRD